MRRSIRERVVEQVFQHRLTRPAWWPRSANPDNAISRLERLRIHRYGFAAGCEAVALPRRKCPPSCWAMPLVRALPDLPKSIASSPINKTFIYLQWLVLQWAPLPNASTGPPVIGCSFHQPGAYRILMYVIQLFHEHALTENRKHVLFRLPQGVSP